MLNGLFILLTIILKDTGGVQPADAVQALVIVTEAIIVVSLVLTADVQGMELDDLVQLIELVPI